MVGCIGSISGMYFYRHVLNPSLKETISEQQTTYNSLWDAVMFGTYEDVEHCIAQGASVTEYDGESALHAAAERGDIKIAELLIKHGADVHAKSYESGWTPLHTAAYVGPVEIAQFFLTQGADVNETSKPISQDVYDLQETALHVAAGAGRLPMVQFLVEHGANVNAQCSGISDLTPLHQAIRSGNKELVAYLIEQGASARDIPGAEPLLITACSHEHESGEMLELLLRHGYDINEQEGEGNNTALMAAVQYDHEEQVKYLLKAHADPNIVDGHGQTALQQAAEYNKVAIAQLLIDHGADINYVDWLDRSALDIALYYEQEEMVAFLKAHGAKHQQTTIPHEQESDSCQT